MPVTFTIASHRAETVRESRDPISNPTDILAKCLRSTEPHAWHRDATARNSEFELLQSSFHSPPSTASSDKSAKMDIDLSKLDLRLEETGFVKTVVQAYNNHHRLVIRPDDVWIAILSQLNLYVNNNAESLRSHFVNHEGKKRLVVGMAGTRYTADFGALARQMADKIQENIIDPSLKDWILPDFSTTTPNDTVICAVMLMSVMQAYFQYTMTLCGIPSITLEGTKLDWDKLLQRIDRLTTLGEEPTAWANLLRPILQRFVQTFDVVQNSHLESKDNLKAEEDLREFYSKITSQYSFGSGSSYLSGWITAFCAWDTHGKWQGSPPAEPRKRSGRSLSHPKVLIDGVHYPIITTNSVPMGTCKVEEVIVIEPDGETTCSMIAGHVANVVEGEADSLRPLGCWFIYTRPPQAVDQMQPASESPSQDTAERAAKLDWQSAYRPPPQKTWGQSLKDILFHKNR